MAPIRPKPSTIQFLLIGLLALAAAVVGAQPVEPVITLARKEKAPLLDTLSP